MGSVTTTLPAGAIFDMDGSLVDSRRIIHHLTGPVFDLDRYMRESLDMPANQNVLRYLRRLEAAGIPPLIATARGERYRDVTEAWLGKERIEPAGIWLRTDGDERHDSDIKRDLLAQIRRSWAPAVSVDDNDYVVEMWRAEGITTVHVPGYSIPVPYGVPIQIETPMLLAGVFGELLGATA